MVYLSLLAYGRYRQNLLDKNKSENVNPLVPQDDDIQIIKEENSQNSKNKFKAFSSSFSNVNPSRENILPAEPSPSLQKKLVFNISPSNPVKDNPFKKQMIPSTVISQQTKKSGTPPRNQVQSATNTIRQNSDHQDLGSIPQPPVQVKSNSPTKPPVQVKSNSPTKPLVQVKSNSPTKPLVQVKSNSPTKPTKRPSPTLVPSEEPLTKKRSSTLDHVAESVPVPVPIPTSGPTTVPGPQNLEPSQNLCPSKSRNVEETEPQSLKPSGPRNVEVTEPQNLKQSGPRNLETTGPRNVEVTESQNLKPTGHRNPETTEPRNLEPTGPRNVEGTEPKNDSGSVQQMHLIESDITGNQNLTEVHRKKFTGLKITISPSLKHLKNQGWTFENHGRRLNPESEIELIDLADDPPEPRLNKSMEQREENKVEPEPILLTEKEQELVSECKSVTESNIKLNIDQEATLEIKSNSEPTSKSEAVNQLEHRKDSDLEGIPEPGLKPGLMSTVSESPFYLENAFSASNEDAVVGEDFGTVFKTEKAAAMDSNHFRQEQVRFWNEGTKSGWNDGTQPVAKAWNAGTDSIFSVSNSAERLTNNQWNESGEVNTQSYKSANWNPNTHAGTHDWNVYSQNQNTLINTNQSAYYNSGVPAVDRLIGSGFAEDDSFSSPGYYTENQSTMYNDHPTNLTQVFSLPEESSLGGKEDRGSGNRGRGRGGGNWEGGEWEGEWEGGEWEGGEWGSGDWDEGGYRVEGDWNSGSWGRGDLRGGERGFGTRGRRVQGNGDGRGGRSNRGRRGTGELESRRGRGRGRGREGEFNVWRGGGGENRGRGGRGARWDRGGRGRGGGRGRRRGRRGGRGGGEAQMY